MLNLLAAHYSREEFYIPVHVDEIHESERHVEDDQENISETQVENENILCGQNNLNY